MKSEIGMQRWAEAHAFYNIYDQIPSDNRPNIETQEYLWRQRLKKDTPNGKLLTANSFFSDLKKSEKIYLNHITYNLNKIIESGSIYASGGCLIGSVYCTPLTMTPKGLRLHNLGQYIYHKEAPAGNGPMNKPPNTLVFEIALSKNENNNLIGIDYLRLGNIHFSIFDKLQYLLSNEERFNIKRAILSRIKRSLSFLSLTNNIYFNGSINKNIHDKQKYLDLFVETVGDLPFLGYLYFETISEYLMLYQNSDLAKKYLELGEFYNEPYKELVYRCKPRLIKNFTLRDFQPRVEETFKQIKRISCLRNPNLNLYINFLFDRLVFHTNSKIFSDLSKPLIWQDISWNFEKIAGFFKPLVGHLIHRELRSFGRYPDFYFYFDQLKALEIWNYWNHMNIAIPFNGIIPKGEVGINPAYSDLKYKVYQGKIVSRNNMDFVEPVKELKIEFTPRLVDLKFTFMRNKDLAQNND